MVDGAFSTLYDYIRQCNLINQWGKLLYWEMQHVSTGSMKEIHECEMITGHNALADNWQPFSFYEPQIYR